MNIETEIKETIEGLFSSIDAIANEKYEQVKDLLKIDTSDPDSFFYSFTYPVEQVIETLIKQDAVHGDKLVFLYQNYQYVERQFNKVICQIEGSACCSDKSRTIVRALAKFFKSGKEIAFNYDQEYTYHLPKQILKTHDDIISYFDGLRFLHYGSPEKYLQQQLKLIKA